MPNKKIIAVFLSFLLIFVLSLQVILKSDGFAPFLFQVLFNKNIELKTEGERINLVLLGIGGGKHEGPNLSDTIIFASVNLKDPKVTLVSIPRDVWIPELHGKINSAYQDGEAKRKGGGLTLAETVVSNLTGQKVDYGVVVDFSAFVKGVDILGGLDIYVDRAFDDYQYPIEGQENDSCGHSDQEIKDFTASNSAETELLKFFPCRYEHIHFNKGLNHMNGDEALKYVRSRHAVGSEGTDFARSQRQEKIIRALVAKSFSLQILANPAKALDLYSAFGSSVNTDIKQNEIDDFIKLSGRFNKAKIQSVVVDTGDPSTGRGGLLEHPDISSKYNYEWVLIPRTGSNNFSEIHEYIRCSLSQTNCIVSEIP